MEYFKKFCRGELYEGRGMYLPHVTLLNFIEGKKENTCWKEIYYINPADIMIK